jgi:hypothetical protein
MHWPGYVQGGQEAKRGYLLLGVYHRRIPGSTTLIKNLCILHDEISKRKKNENNLKIRNKTNSLRNLKHELVLRHYIILEAKCVENWKCETH